MAVQETATELGTHLWVSLDAAMAVSWKNTHGLLEQLWGSSEAIILKL